MLKLYYTDPPGTENAVSHQEISNYVIHATWSGDTDQAARKLEFTIAYNTAEKDAAFVPLNLLLGGTIEASDVEETTETPIFIGRIFFRKRASDSFTFEFTCYDNMVYLAKSNIRANFKDIDVTSAVKQVCGSIGLETADNIPSIPTVVNFIADDKSGTEVLQILFDKAKADQGKNYRAISIGGKITVVERGETIENYIADSSVNVISAEHSESLEDMVDKVVAVNDDGSVGQIFTIDDEIGKYGTIQKIYKIQPPKSGESVDNVTAAKALLKAPKEESSLKALGNIQCISGYAITVQEEQLKGKFTIKSDTHHFENGIHTMDLTLEYIGEAEK